ncbi:hypothetical protein DPMN_148423 [Dreissena polymorpha]|uniref:Uncharacterized protein n=1 Tax=Dreissena polymorpha TaxID=45954 RepID=A0A9D4J1I5_DREPO|nr:hypothetical protein DPMN_148423 [Dreissena polymorpha]
MSKELLDLIDFTPYGREIPTAQHEEIDKLSDTFHRSRLQGPHLKDAYYYTAARPQMAYADSDDVNMNNRFLSRDKPFFNQEYTSGGADVEYPVNDMQSTYPPEIKHPIAGYSPRFLNQRPARRFGQLNRTPACHPAYNDHGQSHMDLQLKKTGNLTKTLTYDGKSNWRAFYVKFAKYAEAQRWSAQDCKDNLCWCLTGKAGDFFANVVE